MPHNTKIVAILNVTPDSFSDGDEHFTPDAALRATQRAIEEGADVIDIGAESTRPGATPLSGEEEWQRLEPVLQHLPRVPSIEFSVDTYHPENATKALALGVDWINDVSGFANPAMIQAVKNSDCKLVVMHSLGVPADKNIVLSPEADPVAELLAFAKKRFAELEQAGIKRSRLIFDPGIGFGKTAEQSKILLERISQFKPLGVPLFIGHSRKSFLGISGSSEKRDTATLVVSRKLVGEGVDYLRVHNVKLHRQMLEELAHAA